MTNKSILIISTYPIKSPRHGGQKRNDALYRAYAAEFREVVYSAVFYGGYYDDYGTYDIALGPEGEKAVISSPLTGDIICGEAIYDDPVVKHRMREIIRKVKPDIIHVEQPYPYLGLKPLLDEMRLKPKIIFGSQNIEAPMKREVLESYGTNEDAIKEAETTIEKLERDFSTSCDLLVACTESDLAVHKSLGAKRSVLARNGIAPSVTSVADIERWHSKFRKRGIVHPVLFVGSAHPPNWVGYLDMVGKGLGFMALDTALVVAGSISDFFEREIKEDAKNIEDTTFWLRAISAGRLSEESLGSLISQSEVMLLPITEGGGSNLKTAEAILANKKVVTTSHALRSFEWFKDFPNVWVADTSTDFRNAIGRAVSTPFIERTDEQRKQADVVRWENCLADLIEEVKRL